MQVAKDLLGNLVVRRMASSRLLVGRIVETEAYHGQKDRASHAFRGRTPRNSPMFGPGGIAYVYQIYGMWNCLNAVTMGIEYPAAVLIRAISQVPSYPLLQADPRAGSGPGKLCRALAVEKGMSGADLVNGDELWLAEGESPMDRSLLRSGPRIGVGYAEEWAEVPWRFWIAGEPSVSRIPGSRLPGTTRATGS